RSSWFPRWPRCCWPGSSAGPVPGSWPTGRSPRGPATSRWPAWGWPPAGRRVAPGGGRGGGATRRRAAARPGAGDGGPGRPPGARELLLAAGRLLGRGLGTAAGIAAGAAAAALGTGFLGYLTWARVTDPGSSCGCTATRHEPITWRAFARAGLVLAGGLAVAGG